MSAKSVRNRRRKEKERQARKEAEAVVAALGQPWRAMRGPSLVMTFDQFRDATQAALIPHLRLAEAIEQFDDVPPVAP